MEGVLQRLQPDVDAIAMAAAVADVRRADGPAVEKPSKAVVLDQLRDGWELVPDLLAGLYRVAAPGKSVLGFAAPRETTHRFSNGERTEASPEKVATSSWSIRSIAQARVFWSGSQRWMASYDAGCRELPVTSKLQLAHQLLTLCWTISTIIRQVVETCGRGAQIPVSGL